MKLEGYLKIDEIPGESARRGHEGEMEVHSIGFSMQAPFDQHAKARRGRVSVSTITFVKHYDKGSPYLKKACFDNRLFAEVVFAARRSIEGEDDDYLVVTLANSSVVAYALQPSEDEPGRLQERIEFACETLSFTYDRTHHVALQLQRSR